MTQTKGGNHQQEYLAKFGSRPDMKAQKIKNPFMFWLPAGTCCKIWVFFIKKFKSWRIWTIFFMKIIKFSGCNNAKKCQRKQWSKEEKKPRKED
jgi:hypothetical protein